MRLGHCLRVGRERLREREKLKVFVIPLQILGLHVDLIFPRLKKKNPLNPCWDDVALNTEDLISRGTRKWVEVKTIIDELFLILEATAT